MVNTIMYCLSNHQMQANLPYKIIRIHQYYVCPNAKCRLACTPFGLVGCSLSGRKMRRCCRRASTHSNSCRGIKRTVSVIHASEEWRMHLLIDDFAQQHTLCNAVTAPSQRPLACDLPSAAHAVCVLVFFIFPKPLLCAQASLDSSLNMCSYSARISLLPCVRRLRLAVRCCGAHRCPHEYHAVCVEFRADSARASEPSRRLLWTV